MKMKFALLFLPALMALSSCGAAAQPVAEKTFLEDTTAHSEIFGGNDVIGGQLQIKNRAKGEAITAPKIGYQIKYAGGKLAVRFVAAINDLNVKAYWRRGVAAPDGSTLADKDFSDDGQQVTKYYTSLSADGSAIEAGVGDYVGYEGFVVFSIYNIPYDSTTKDAYLAAYVNLVADENGEDNGAGGTYNIHRNSMALAVKLERKTEAAGEDELMNVFAFDPTVTGHFLEGTIGGVVYDGGTNGLYRESGSTPAGNNAWYENIQLKEGDSFGSFYYRHDDVLKYCGYSDFFTAHSSDFDASSLSGYASPKKEGKYHLYVSSGDSDQIYSNRLTYHVSFYLDATKLDAWTPPASGYFVHAYNGGAIYSGDWGAGTMSLVTGEEHLYLYVIEMAVGNEIANVILGFNQNGDPKESVSVSVSTPLGSNISDTGSYDITYDDAVWSDGKMSASIAAHA